MLLKYKVFSGTKNIPFKYSSTISQSINRGMNAARQLQVTGTPTIFDESFKKINWGKLLRDERAKKQKTILKK